MKNMHTFARLRRGLALLFCFTLGIGAAHAGDTVTYYHTDALGTPVMESNAAGQVTYAREHKPYGEQTLGAAKNGPGFTGHVADIDTELTYMQARYYDPIAARFLSNDPLAANTENGGNYNRYWYGNSSPYKFTDPDGRLAFSGHLCDMGCDSGSFIAGGGGGGGGREEVEETVDSYKDLPTLPKGEYSLGKGLGNFSGEGWERVERWTGKQDVIWNEIPDDRWAEVPLVNVHKIPAKSPTLLSIAIDAALPELKFARQNGWWGMEQQVGYRHVYYHMRDGAYESPVAVQIGHGTIWTNQKYWKKDFSQPFRRTRFKVGW